jgi:hypothetical protein
MTCLNPVNYFPMLDITVLMTILVGAAAFGHSKLQTPVYEASVQVS